MTSSEQVAPKPRLLFFRWTREGLAPFVHDQLAEQLRGLSLFFDVTLVDHDGDFDALCDQHRPDLVLFESGVYVGPRRLANLDTHPEVPRAGFLNADAFDPVRGVFLADMAAWGVETYFTVSASMAAYTPEIVDRLFCWPNWVDPRVHRDHGLPKVVPILLTGSQARHYPWRNRVNTVLAQHYPVLSTPHFGWLDSAGARTMLVGEAYSRMINSASFAPSCGNFTQDFVRKHLEIPASGTCLVAQRTPATEAAGFVDLVNCVLADEDDVLEKVGHLFTHPDELAAVTEAGRQLVLERHTAERRSQVRDWFELVSVGERAIVQDDPFAPLRAAGTGTGTGAGAGAEPMRSGLLHVATSTAEDRAYLREGWAAVAGGRLGAAERAFTGAASFQALPEAVIGSAMTQLLDGRAAEAGTTVGELMARMDRLYQPPTPDPVQWAVHVWALLCRGELAQAAAAAGAHPDLDHVELRRTRVLVAALTAYVAEPAPASPRASANPLPATSWDQWLRRAAAMLRANDQADAAAVVGSLLGSAEPQAAAGALPTIGHRSADDHTMTPQSRPATLPRAVVGRGSAHARRWLGRGAEHLREQARTWVGQTWLDAIAEVVERESLDTVVVVGPSRMSLRERSLRLAAARNPRVPRVLDVAAEGSDLADSAAQGRILLHLGRRAVVTDAVTALAATSRVVVLEDALRPQVTRLADRLVDSGDFELIALSRSRGGGYYVFRHRLGQPQAPPSDQPSDPPSDQQGSRPTSQHTHSHAHLVTHGEPA